MLPQPTNAVPPVSVRIGVGIDTSRYGHYAAFLDESLQAAAGELAFAESADGYFLLRQQLLHIVQRRGAVHFVVRLDAAGQYADNLTHFLHGLSAAGADPARLAHVSISCGDPQRNKNYRAAVYGNKKSDPIEARAAARFALTERPAHTPPLTQPLRVLRQIAGRLQAVVRQRTRLINQLHHLLVLAFPELALVVKDIATGWVLELLHRFPTAQLLAAADASQLEAIPYLPHALIVNLLERARSSVASLQGPAIAELVRDQVRQLRDVQARQKRLEKLLGDAYHALPNSNCLNTIPGIGDVTAAVLSAFILDIERFDSPHKLVAYFGTLPIEASSGVDRDGQPRGPKRYVMSKRGNDLVRRYLWVAALSAIRFNPAVRALYARVVAKHPNQKAIAVGHAMRKLLHLVFAVWKTGRPFDPCHYPWDTPAHVDAGDPPQPEVRNQQAAGLKNPAEPVRKEVTAASADKAAQAAALSEPTFVDFAHVKRQLPLSRVLDQLGVAPSLRGRGPQRRGPCPLHRGDGRGRTFSVHLDDNVFHCFDTQCGKKGDVIDLWAALHGLPLRQAALDLVHTFGLEPAPRTGTEKRQG